MIRFIGLSLAAAAAALVLSIVLVGIVDLPNHPEAVSKARVPGCSAVRC